MKHQRKCWDCGAINWHMDNVAPEVLCKECGSQDTRPVKRKHVPVNQRKESLAEFCRERIAEAQARTMPGVPIHKASELARRARSHVAIYAEILEVLGDE